MVEQRDAAVKVLASPATKDPADVARLQQEIGTLTVLIGDDPDVMGLKDYMKEELTTHLREQAEQANG